MTQCHSAGTGTNIVKVWLHCILWAVKGWCGIVSGKIGVKQQLKPDGF